MDKPSLVVKNVTQMIFPFVFMFGIYIVLHGSSSPGGGFQGGVVMGAAYILFAIGYDPREARKLTPAVNLKILEAAGVLLYVGIGLVGVLLGYSFLANRTAGFPPQGLPGSLFSGGTLLGINIGIGTHVAATVITLFHAFLEFEPENSRDLPENKEEKP